MNQIPLSEILQVDERSGPPSVVGKISSIMRALAATDEAGIRLIDLAEVTHIPQPTAHRLLKELISEGLVRQAPDRSYLLGPALWHLTQRSPSPIPHLEHLKTIADDLATTTGDTIYLAINSLGKSRYLYRTAGTFPLRGEKVDIGERLPFTTTYSGLVLLAMQPINVREQALEEVAQAPAEKWFELTPRRHRNRLASALKLFDDTGFITGPHLVIPGLNGLAAPIINTADLQLAVSVSADLGRMPAKRAKALMPLLKGAAQQMSDEIG